MLIFTLHSMQASPIKSNLSDLLMTMRFESFLFYVPDQGSHVGVLTFSRRHSWAQGYFRFYSFLTIFFTRRGGTFYLLCHIIQVLPAVLEVPLDYTDLKVLSKALSARFTVLWHPAWSGASLLFFPAWFRNMFQSNFWTFTNKHERAQLH